MRPKLLDLFCKAGGAAVGYHRAGFDVIGVDIEKQPRYPFPMVVADALAPPFDLSEFAAIHASPPCQKFSKMQSWNKNSEAHPDLVGPTRTLLRASGLPYVIENVPGAPLFDPVVLCGVMFGLRVYRHRLFESNMALFAPAHGKHPVKMPSAGSGVGPDGYVSVNNGGIRGCKNPHEVCSKAMGIDWMTRVELSNAIPPEYTEFLGRQLMRIVLGSCG